MPEMVTRIDKDQEQDLRAVMGKLNLSIRALSTRANVAIGSVERFLTAKSMTAGRANRIYLQLREAANRTSLDRADALFVRKTLEAVGETLESNTVEQTRGFRGAKSQRTSASHVVELIMALTKAPRMNLSKDFTYTSTEHFDAHVQCVRNDVTYRWLVYERRDSRAPDEDRPGQCKLMGRWLTYHNDLKAHLPATNTGGDPLKLLECRVYPMVAQHPGRRVPFRLTMFANTTKDGRRHSGKPVDGRPPRSCIDDVWIDDVCVCTEEREVETYKFGQSFLIRSEEVWPVQAALEKLYFQCPTIEEWNNDTEQVGVRRSELVKSHDELCAQVLHAFLKESFAARIPNPWAG